MTWYEVQTAGTAIDYGEWNTMVTHINSVLNDNGTVTTDGYIDVGVGYLKINHVAVSTTAAQLNVLNGVTCTTGELNYNDITAVGTVEDNKMWHCANTTGITYMPQKKYLQLEEEPTTNVYGSGIIINDNVGETVAVGNVLYYDSAGTWKMAKGLTEATTKGALALAMGTTGAINMMTYGFFKNTAWGFTAGQTLYVSDATFGLITASQPTGAGHVVRVVGHAISPTVIFFNPSQVWIELV